MKRPLGLWILLSAGILWLNTQDVHGVRATSLIFGKSSTTTTTTSKTTASSGEISDSSEEEPTTEADGEATNNGTKRLLTGIPQIDYIWDPNLPKELNGYNLSHYPFYERVPENITFKCDGLHDGFYASVEHKCQVYHHCLFGIRYDFLCANYTAFDQTLFNCNFVSKVDCKNSKNFWSRNDELYKTKSTPPPPVVYSFYTQSPPTYPAASGPSRRNPLLRRIPPPNVNPVPVEAGPAQQLPPQSGVEIPVDVAGREIPQVPEAPRRRPLRPRPYYDYYDDYDEPQYYRRKRPRPRPYYDDDEYEYYDERYERRGEGRRRRPYDRPTRRYKGRRDKYEDEEDEMYDEDERYADDEEPRKRKVNRGGSMSGSKNKPRRQPPRRQNPGKSNKKQPDYYYDDEYDDKPVHRRPQAESSKNRNPSRRPSYEYEDEEEVDNNRKNRRGSSTDISSESKTMIKPTSGTLFDRPRVAPKINLPVPKNVADKFSYKAMSAKTKETIPTDEYSDKPTTNKYAEKITTPETHDAITTMRGNFKRQPYGSRRPNEGKPSTSSPGRKMKPVQLDESEEDEEIQEEDVLQKDSKRLQNHERRGYLTRYNMFKTRHSLSTPEAREEEDPDDLTEIDDSINEA